MPRATEPAEIHPTIAAASISTGRRFASTAATSTDLIQIKVSTPYCRQPPLTCSEETMQGNEFYYLVLVLGAFGGFGLAVAIATLQYKSWIKRN